MAGSARLYLGGGGVGDLPQDDHAATLAGADLLSTGGHLDLGQGCGPGEEGEEEEEEAYSQETAGHPGLTRFSR